MSATDLIGPSHAAAGAPQQEIRIPHSTSVPGRYRAVWLLIVILVAAYYGWQTNIGGDRFMWSGHLDGYYDLLARGFLNGHLYLPVEPRAELLALADPWKAPENRPWRLLDAVLYNRHYYLYHGAAPALVLFAPWRLITRHDLPQNVATALFSFGGFLFLCELLIAVLSLRTLPPLWLFLLFCFALGIGQCAPFLLQESLMYQVAIASGLFFVSGGYLFLFKLLSAQESRPGLAAASGLFFGLAAGCRPHLGIATAPVLLILVFARRRSGPFSIPIARKDAMAFAAPVVLCALAICGYNFARFGNPLEFGLKYQLGEPVYQDIALSPVNLLPGIYYMLACAPYVNGVFPFFRLAIRPPFNSVHYALPSRYFLEPTAGAIYLCPIALIALASPVLIRRLRNCPPARLIVMAMYVYAIGCIVFIALTGLNSQRFEVDFLPYLLLIGCVLAADGLSGLGRPARSWGYAAVSLAIVYSAAINLSLGVQGFTDEWLRNRPEQYVRMARWFSPVKRFRPFLNPWIDEKAYFEFPQYYGVTEPQPLIAAGEFGSRYMLSGSRIEPGCLRLTSEEGTNVRSTEVNLDPRKPGLLEAQFQPGQREMLVYWNGQMVMRHRLAFLITAEAQIRFGLDTTFMSKHRFPGRIRIVRKELRPVPPG